MRAERALVFKCDCELYYNIVYARITFFFVSFHPLTAQTREFIEEFKGKSRCGPMSDANKAFRILKQLLNSR